MKRANRILLAVGFLVLLIISWVIVLGSKSSDEKQTELLSQAAEYTNDKVYILAVPLLEEAAGYDAAYTREAEAALKDVYLQLLDQRGYRRKYLDLLGKQMSRLEAPPDVFEEAARFYLDGSKYAEAFAVLKDGIAKTGSGELITLYEDNRYIHKLGYELYEDVTEIHGTTIGVSRDGLWGLADSAGTQLIPCEYESISTFDADRAVVRKNGEIYAVDRQNNRLALLKEKVSAFGNYADGRVTLLTAEGWKRATGDFTLGSAAFEQIGTYSGGYAAAKLNGKWGVINKETNWLIPAEYDEVVLDGLGRCYAQGAVFAKKGESVILLVDGQQVGEAFEDAKPFRDEGYAAVKKNGKWGFINTAGELEIDFQFEDALSFGQHLAAVQVNGLWGYINLYGKTVIEPAYLQAKSFGNGNAPVLTERGWQFLALLEYQKGVSL